MPAAGSRALAGQLAAADLDRARGGQDRLEAGMLRLGITRQSVLGARREPKEIVAYVELHIEQGTRLEEGGIDIGVVTAIVGVRSYWLRFFGRAAHAGTTPMSERADAAWAAADFIRRARDIVTSRFSPGVMNCGALYLQPGAFNIVPSEARLALEFRHGTEAQLDEMEQELLEVAGEAARANRTSLETEPSERVISVLMDSHVMEAIERATATLGLSHTRLMSMAGHDAQIMVSVAPCGMIFVPSVGGASHNATELTNPSDAVRGANTLLHTLLELVPNTG